MKIGIIGLGAVGTANNNGFERVGHYVVGHDKRLLTDINDIIDTKVVFICVPTPSLEDGKCDVSIVTSVIDELNEMNYDGVVAIRSTCYPGFTQSMIDKYKNLTITFVPEFLRERSATEDFIHNHNLLAVGTSNEEVFNIITHAHGSLPKHTVQLTPTEAELLKYYNNVYAAARVIFANIMYELCDKLDCDYSRIKNAYIKTGKATDMYLDVNEGMRGYGGMCLPKDTKAIAALLDEHNIDFEMINAIDADNSKLKTTVFPGMRL